MGTGTPYNKIKFSQLLDTLYLLQDCSIAVPSFDAENVGDALELWKMTERVVGLS